MASKAEKTLKTEKMASTGINPKLAAIQYVNNGLDNLNLKPQEKNALKNKLIPIITTHITNERGRSTSRASMIVARETKARIKKASESM